MAQRCLKFYSPTSDGFEHALLTKRLTDFIGEKSSPEIEEEACFYVIVEHERYVDKLLNDDNDHLVGCQI
jgi:hypothetical protein